MNELEKRIAQAVRLAGYSPNENAQGARAEKLSLVLVNHPEADIVVVRDEYTGCRFGKSKRNAGRCHKLGSNSTTHGGNGRNCYQVWARW